MKSSTFSTACFLVWSVFASACADNVGADTAPTSSQETSADVVTTNGGAGGSNDNAAGTANEEQPTNNDHDCVPGDSKDCACGNGDNGAQVCSDDGKRYGPCLCEGMPSTGGTTGVKTPDNTSGAGVAGNPATNGGNGGNVEMNVGGNAGETDVDLAVAGSTSPDAETAGNGGASNEPNVAAGGFAGETDVDLAAAGSTSPDAETAGAGGSSGSSSSPTGGTTANTGGTGGTTITCSDTTTLVVTIEKQCADSTCETFGVGTLWSSIYGERTCTDAGDRMECLLQFPNWYGAVYTTFHAFSSGLEGWMPGKPDGVHCVVPRKHSIRQVFDDGSSVVLEESVDYEPVDNSQGGCHWMVTPFEDPTCS